MSLRRKERLEHVFGNGCDVRDPHPPLRLESAGSEARMFPQRDCSRSPQEIGAGRITRPENSSRKQLLMSVHRLVRGRQVSGSHSSRVTAKSNARGLEFSLTLRAGEHAVHPIFVKLSDQASLPCDFDLVGGYSHPAASAAALSRFTKEGKLLCNAALFI